MSNSTDRKVPEDLKAQVQKIEDAIKRRVAIGTRIAYVKLCEEMENRFSNRRAVDLAILSLVGRADFVHHEARKVVERKRWAYSICIL